MNEAPANPQVQQRRPHADRPKKRDVNGWIILDKGVGMTSTHAVAVVKRGLSAKKAGHAGTLDPLASGILPIALGEATKTVPFIMDGRKSYVFTVAWGEETNTDDAEGEVVGQTDLVPEPSAIEALLPRFIGQVQQVPPRFSAIKIQGERAYDLARGGEVVELQPRTVEIDRISLVHHEGNRSVLEADCGKGTYVRAIARDLGRALGCLGHIAALRRTRVGPFTEADAVVVDDLATDPAALRPVEIGSSGPALHRRQPRHGGPAHARAIDHSSRTRRAHLRQDLRHLQRRPGRRRRCGARGTGAAPGVQSGGVKLTNSSLVREPYAGYHSTWRSGTHGVEISKIQRSYGRSTTSAARGA